MACHGAQSIYCIKWEPRVNGELSRGEKASDTRETKKEWNTRGTQANNTKLRFLHGGSGWLGAPFTRYVQVLFTSESSVRCVWRECTEQYICDGKFRTRFSRVVHSVLLHATSIGREARVVPVNVRRHLRVGNVRRGTAADGRNHRIAR